MVLKHFGRILQAEEVPPEFSQADLAIDDIMILDTFDQVGPSFIDSVWALMEIFMWLNYPQNLVLSCQIFIWIGKDAREDEKEGCLKIGLYI